MFRREDRSILHRPRDERQQPRGRQRGAATLYTSSRDRSTSALGGSHARPSPYSVRLRSWRMAAAAIEHQQTQHRDEQHGTHRLRDCVARAPRCPPVPP